MVKVSSLICGFGIDLEAELGRRIDQRLHILFVLSGEDVNVLRRVRETVQHRGALADEEVGDVLANQGAVEFLDVATAG